MQAVISRPGTFSKVVQAVISRSRGAGGSGQRPSSLATEDNCMTAVPGAVVGARPGITAPLGNARRAEKAVFAREEKPVVTLGGQKGHYLHGAGNQW